MLHHERLRPPSHDYPADEWNVIEKAFHPEFLAQLETMSALGNGYLGMRGCPEEGGPNAENGTFINGFYETRPIVYGEEAYGFAKTGQTICNVTDSKIIKLFVDDEPFWLPNAHLLKYDRRLNMKSGTLDRKILWETPAGKQVSITSRRLVSFPNRHVAAISYCVTLLNAQAFVVISSEMAANGTSVLDDGGDPRLARAFLGRVLHPRASYSRDRCIVLCHATEKSRFTLTCATDNALESLLLTLLQSYAHRGLRPSRLHNRGAARLSNPPHQVHGLSRLADGFRRGALRPCRMDIGSGSEPGIPAAARGSRAVHG